MSATYTTFRTHTLSQSDVIMSEKGIGLDTFTSKLQYFK